VLATFHPALSSPMMFSFGTATLSKNVSLNSALPVICFSGRIVIPGARMSTMRQLIPRCIGASESVRASKIPNDANCA
jgi:hypothetical protein